MMKRLHALLITLVMCLAGVGGASAQTTYTVSFDNGATQSTANWFTITDPNINYNPKYAGTYEGNTYSKGLKMQGGTSITFTTSATSKVTIVQSLKKYSTNYVSFDGTAKTASDRIDDATNNVGVYTITNVAAGDHTIKRAGSEMGLLFIQVDEEAVTTTELAAPAISFDASTGAVTIGAVENAESVVYTTDGTDPSATNGTKYTSTFTVEDGTVVKAIALGDGTKYRSSDIASATVLLDNVTIAAPTISSYNGTVALATTTAKATLEYSLDGSIYQTYTKPFTLTEDKTVYARATRSSKYSDVSTLAVTAVAQPEGTTTVMLSGDSIKSGANSSTTVGGYTIAITGNAAKTYTKQGTLTINGTEYAAIKLSNGAQNTLTLPEGKVAKRLVIYSSINGTAESANGWKEVAGTSYENGDGAYSNFPMGSTGQASTDPDVRVYPLDNASSVTFTSAGQLFFVLAIDVADGTAKSDVTLSIDNDGYATLYYSDRALTVPANAKAYTYKIAQNASGDVLNLSKTYEAGSVIPAGTAVLVNAAEGDYTFTVAATDGVADADNVLKGSDEAATTEGGTMYYMFSSGSKGLGFYWGAANGAAFQNGAHKAYIAYTPSSSSSAKSFLAIGKGATTGIGSVIAADNGSDDAVLYNLSGQRVGKGYKGIVVRNGSKFVNK